MRKSFRRSASTAIAACVLDDKNDRFIEYLDRKGVPYANPTPVIPRSQRLLCRPDPAKRARFPRRLPPHGGHGKVTDRSHAFRRGGDSGLLPESLKLIPTTPLFVPLLAR